MRYDALLCGSTWNADLLSSSTGRPVKVIFEGVDTSIFCPGTKSGVLSPDKFYVFSGGKLEYRKGQDLTLLAFREFSRKHADAVHGRSAPRAFAGDSNDQLNSPNKAVWTSSDGHMKTVSILIALLTLARYLMG
jgi:glycosyltransferase involved in cell wall biosynthesis